MSHLRGQAGLSVHSIPCTNSLFTPPLWLAQGSERPVKDSAQSMHSARSSGGKSDMRTSGSGSTTVRSMLDTLYSSKGISGQVRRRPPVLTCGAFIQLLAPWSICLTDLAVYLLTLACLSDDRSSFSVSVCRLENLCLVHTAMHLARACVQHSCLEFCAPSEEPQLLLRRCALGVTRGWTTGCVTGGAGAGVAEQKVADAAGDAERLGDRPRRARNLSSPRRHRVGARLRRIRPGEPPARCTPVFQPRYDFRLPVLVCLPLSGACHLSCHHLACVAS